MVKTKFSTSWNSSVQPRKQRKYRFNAPLHIKQSFLGVHLSAELRAKHGARSVSVRKGDKVKVMRGQFAKKEGKVESVSIKQQYVIVAGVERSKLDGSKVAVKLHPSNLMITSLDLSDARRKKKLTSGAKEAKPSPKVSQPKQEKQSENKSK